MPSATIRRYARAAGPCSVATGATATLDAAASFDSDGSIVRYDWDFDGEGDYDQSCAELVHRRGPRRTIEQLELALFEYLDWWNHRRLHGEIGMITPVEKETAYYRQTRPLETAGSQ